MEAEALRRSILPTLTRFVTLPLGLAFSLPLFAADPWVMAPADMPKLEKIAEELAYKPAEFSRYVDDFVVALSQGSKSQALQRICARDEESCLLIKDYQNQASDAKRARRRVKRFRITEKNVAQAQRFDFQVLVASLKVENEYRLFELAEKSLKEVDCPRNLSAALAVKAEEYFPHAKARNLVKELFEHARHCLQPEETAYERLFLRQGLYAYYDGDKERAKSLLEAAKKAKTPNEKYRTLYWLGRIAHDKGVDSSDNLDWKELMNSYPLSFYAIEAAAAQKLDPVAMITQRRVGGLKRDAGDDTELNRQVRWLEALYLKKKASAVAKWASWIVRSNEDDLDVDVLHYISTLKIASGMYRSNISMLFSYFKKNPATLNEEGLRLLYPRPYYSLLQDASRGKIDTFLVMGLVRQESAFDSRATSRAKAKGLMQIIPGTARRLASQGHKKLYNEKDNAQMGVKYLVQLGNQFNGQAELVLAAYNAGPHRVDEWLKRNPDRDKDVLLWNDLIPYMETRDYVVSILRNNYIYSKLYGNETAPSDKLFSSKLVRDLLLTSH
jgi:soluble lytic murein transglycosylase-like protein